MLWRSTRFASASGENGWHRSATSIYFDIFPYKVSQETGFIDYDKLEEKALDFWPKLIICGGSAYLRDWDYARFHVVPPFFGFFLYIQIYHMFCLFLILKTILISLKGTSSESG